MTVEDLVIRVSLSGRSDHPWAMVSADPCDDAITDAPEGASREELVEWVKGVVNAALDAWLEGEL